MSCLALIQKSWGHFFLSKLLRYLLMNDYSRVSTFLLGSPSGVSVVEPSSSSLSVSSSTDFSVSLASPSKLSTSVMASTSAVAFLSCGPSS